MVRIYKTLVLSLLTILLFMYGCGTTRLMVPVTRPAEVNLSKFKTIAIGDITGNGGQDLAEDLTARLFQSGRFEVLDRQHLERILKEHNLSFSGLVDETYAAGLGELFGTSALVFGRVAKYEYKEDLTDEKYETTDKKGKVTKHTEYTRTGKINMDVSLQITDLTTGKIIAVKKISKSNGERKTNIDDQPEKIDKDKWLRWGYQAVAGEFMKMIAPYQEKVEVKLLTDGDMPELESGINLAKIGQWDTAIGFFEQAIKNNEMNPKVKIDKAWFDLGVAYEYTYQFDKAEEAVMKAYTINADKDYAEELKSIKRLQSEQEKLNEQMQN